MLTARAHPHSRGENFVGAFGRDNPKGSSPLTRGKLRRPHAAVSITGLIPTHAGKTSGDRPPRHRQRAHPHSRGENPGNHSYCVPSWGSSPLTRGKPVIDSTVAHRGRLIPTHAGKTSIRPCHSIRSTAHPHSRGENLGRRLAADTGRGSSPLTRGKRFRVHP